MDIIKIIISILCLIGIMTGITPITILFGLVLGLGNSSTAYIENDLKSNSQARQVQVSTKVKSEVKEDVNSPTYLTSSNLTPTYEFISPFRLFYKSIGIRSPPLKI